MIKKRTVFKTSIVYSLVTKLDRSSWISSTWSSFYPLSPSPTITFLYLYKNMFKINLCHCTNFKYTYKLVRFDLFQHALSILCTWHPCSYWILTIPWKINVLVSSLLIRHSYLWTGPRFNSKSLSLVLLTWQCTVVWWRLVVRSMKNMYLIKHTPLTRHLMHHLNPLPQH